MSAQDYNQINLEVVRKHILHVAHDLDLEGQPFESNDLQILSGYIYPASSEDDLETNWQDIQDCLIYGGTSLDVEILSQVYELEPHPELEKLMELLG